MSVDVNKKIWKIKISLNAKAFAWHLDRGVILTKDNLVKCNWYQSNNSLFCHHNDIIKKYSSNANFLDLYSLHVGSTLYPTRSIANISDNLIMGSIIGLKCLLGWVPLFCRYCYIEMPRFLMIKILVRSYRLSTGARHCSVHGRI
jgi:hypothetical protein